LLFRVGAHEGLKSGSKTVRKGVIAALAAEGAGLEWSAARIFWADVRCVPPEHPDCDFLAAHRGLLQPLHLSDAQVHRIHGAPKPPPDSVSLGMGALIAAREVWVVIAGAGKEDALRESLATDGRTPLALLLRRRHATRILTLI
jgi:6-phosphogluconolactonase